jgi:hypothetical protein
VSFNSDLYARSRQRPSSLAPPLLDKGSDRRAIVHHVLPTTDLQDARSLKLCGTRADEASKSQPAD